VATDATGAVTSPDNIPTYNTAADAPSGKGLNAIVAAVQAAITARNPGVGTNGQWLRTTGGAAVWTTPSWVDADINAAAAINRDKLDRSVTQVYKSAAQSIPNATFTFVNFDSEFVDDKNQHDNVTNNTRITFATAGAYVIGWQMVWANFPGGDRLAQLRVSGGSDYAISIIPRDASFGTAPSTGVDIHVMAANDYIEMLAYQSSGGAVNTGSGTGGPRMWAYKL
jgi:hypothetical protein